LTENRQAARLDANLLQYPLRHARRIVIHTNDERSDGVDISLSQTFEHARVFF
jgi:hypothetical protein